MAQRYATVLPRRLVPSRNDLTAIGMWGGTAAFGGLWLVQPWGWIKSVTVGDEEVEEEAKQNDEGRGQPKPPAASSGEDTKSNKEDEGGEGEDSSEGEDDSESKEGGDDSKEEKADEKDESTDESKDEGKDESKGDSKKEEDKKEEKKE